MELKQKIDDDDNATSDLQLVETEDVDLQPPKIFLHALSNVPTPQTMKVNAKILDTPITIRDDSWSTHNFLHKHITRAVKIPIETWPLPWLMTANREKLHNLRLC